MTAVQTFRRFFTALTYMVIMAAPPLTPVAIAASSEAQQLQAIYDYQRLIDTFYTAFAAGDAETMVSCYHPQVQFEDPAFGKLSINTCALRRWRTLVLTRMWVLPTGMPITPSP